MAIHYQPPLIGRTDLELFDRNLGLFVRRVHENRQNRPQVTP